MKFIKYFIFILILATLAVSTATGYFINEFYFKKPIAGAAPMRLTIKQGDSVKKISKNLKSAGIIASPFVFEAYVWLLQLDGIFQPGEYKLLPGQNISSLAEKLTAIYIDEIKLTLIEGWTLRDMAEYLKEKKLIGNTINLDFSAKNFNYDFLADKPASANLEGYVYPDTYRILIQDGVPGLIKKALDNFGRKLTPDLRTEIKRQGKTIFQIVTMASIIEKEVRGYEDRRLAADLFWRRIKIGMPLGADSTINYITGSGRDRSTYDDLKINSPYNTYKYAGLPRGPISNPSIESIRAAIYPAPNNYLYFLTDKDGGVHYAKTAAEHARNRAKYLE